MLLFKLFYSDLLIEVIMGTISKAVFNRDIAELVQRTEGLDLRYQWQFNDVSTAFHQHFLKLLTGQ